MIYVSRFLPTKGNIKSWKLEKEVKKSLMRVIDERRENWEKEMVDHHNGPKDLLGLMIQASLKESLLNSSPSITLHDIAEECKSFFFAGEQTTSNLLTWTTLLLAMHPEWQVLARDEVLKVCGPRDIPTKDDVSKLKIVSYPFNFSLLSSFKCHRIKYYKYHYFIKINMKMKHFVFVF